MSEKKSVLHLVNQEAVVVESLRVARLALARETGLPVDAVLVDLETQGDVVKPRFSLDPIVLERMTDKDVGAVMSRVWRAVKEQLEERLQNLGLTRYE